MPAELKLAFDRSVRRVDQDGRLHVELSNISKANVCPYYGYEIDGSVERGLDPQKVYMLLRDPQELAKAASTFNNIPLLSKHVSVSARAPQKEFVVGSTGTDAQFDGPYLKNSLVVWDQIAIDGIETKEQCELSSAYRYNVDWTPGVYENVAYDGRMVNIIGNHVALVEVGRVGPDVIVGDANPFTTTTEYMTMKPSRKAVAIRAALRTFLAPQIAMDAAIVDINGLMSGVKSATIAADSARIVAAVVAKIPTVDQAALTDAIKFAADGEPDDEAEEDDEETKAKKAAAATKQANDANQPQAMDAAAVNLLLDKRQAETVANMNAIRQAERDVQPIIGDVMGQDSAASVYKMALDHAGVDTTGVDPSAFGAMAKLLVKQRNEATNAPAPAVAMDAASASSFAERFPTAANLKRG